MCYSVCMAYKDPKRQREYQRNWMKFRREEYFNGKTCVDCARAEELQLDHKDSSQKVSHRIWSWSESRRTEELAKCVPRCVDCHKKKTARNKEHLRGEAVTISKLTPDKVRQIREIRKTGLSYRKIGAQYGVNERVIRMIIRGDAWAHVKD